MKKIILLFLLTFTCVAQNKDSLLNVIKNYKFKDSIQCERYNLLIEAENDAAVWIKYNAVLGQIASEKINSKISSKEKKTYYNYLGLHYNNVGYYFEENQKKAIFFYEKAIFFYEKGDDLNSLAQSLQNIGTVYDKFGEPKKTLFYYNQVVKIYEKSQDLKGLANIYADFGRTYGEYGAYNKAFEFYSKSMKISDRINDQPSKIRTIGFQVIALNAQKEYSKMLEYLSIQEKYYLKVKNFEKLNTIYNNFAFVYIELNEHGKMKFYLNKAIELSKKYNSNKNLATAYGHYSSYYLKLNELEKAFYYSNLDVEIITKTQLEPYLTQSLIKHSSILGLKKDYKNALEFGLKAYVNSKKINNLEVLQSASKNLKEIYNATNNKTLAFKYAEEEIKVNDTLNFINTKNSAINSLFKYETEKKEAQIKDLSQQKEIANLESQRQKTIALVLGIVIISILITSYFLFNRFKIKKQNEHLKSQLIQAEKTIEAEKKATESELKALKSQMNPHFIFNALSSIQDQFMFGDKVIANEQMGNFTYLTRQILNVSGKKQILLATEIDILSKYLELEKMRFKTDFEYKISISETIDEDYHEIPPMLIQPFVENSIKHGLLHKNGIKKVTIDFELDTNEEYIICTIIDNGIGRQKSAEIKAKNQNNHQSFSTESIEQRLELLNENLKLENLITYSDIIENDLISGTKVIINIPIV